MPNEKSIVVWCLLFGLAAGAGAQTDPLGEKLKALDERYRESLVQLRFKQQVIVSTAEPPNEQELTTTGVVVSEDGTVLVSGVIYEPFNVVPHGIGIRFPGSVAQGEPQLADARARFVDGSEYPATLLGRDRHADVVFFRIDAGERTFRPVSFDSGTKIEIGQPVAVLSLLPEPLGPAIAVELSRVQSVLDKPSEGFLVGTTAADPVGSLVCGLDGELLGLLDALTVPLPASNPRTPLSFLSVMRELPKGVARAYARPAAHFASAAAQPPDAAPSRRGWLGVEMQALTPELASHLKLPVDSGIILGYVYERSPAASAGLKVGDILVEAQSEPIRVRSDAELGNFGERILKAGAGAELRLAFLRDGERHETLATIAPAPKSAREAETVKVSELDLTVREVTYDFLARRRLGPDTKGVVVEVPPVVVRTNPNRLLRGDLLVRLGDREVEDLGSFRRLIERLRQDAPEEVVLFVERGQESFFFAIKPEWN